MNLKLRLALLLLALFIAMAMAGSAIAIIKARQSIAEEIESSANLTMEILSTAIISGDSRSRAEANSLLIGQLQKLDKIKHLNIALSQADGTIVRPTRRDEAASGPTAPAWFASLVEPPPVEYRRRLAGPGISPTEIVIVPDPLEEIFDAWDHIRSLIALILLFTALSMLLAWMTIKRALQPLEQVLEGLGEIRQGDYGTRLPGFDLPEMNRLSRQFNHMARVLDKQQSENRQLSRRMLEIQENERRHLARELHDELGQSISAIKAMAITLDQKTEACEKGRQSIVEVCNHMYNVVRSMMKRLRPVVLDELGLVTALERLVDDWNDHHENTFCALRIEGNFQAPGEQTGICVYRIVQEALTNVAKHAAASEASILLQRENNGEIRLTIRDNGEGFDNANLSSGMGLSGMRERVQSLNGKLSLAANRGEGVKIDISIPAQTE